MVEYITYKKEKLPLLVSYRVGKYYKKETGKNISDNEFDSIETLLFLALESGFRYEDKEFKYKKEDMEFILDECFTEFNKLLPSFFPNEDVSIDKKKSTKK